MLDAVGLAALALKTLETQKKYFATRDHNVLLESKALETRLRFESNEIMSKQNRLFPEDERQGTGV